MCRWVKSRSLRPYTFSWKREGRRQNTLARSNFLHELNQKSLSCIYNITKQHAKFTTVITCCVLCSCVAHIVLLMSWHIIKIFLWEHLEDSALKYEHFNSENSEKVVPSFFSVTWFCNKPAAVQFRSRGRCCRVFDKLFSTNADRATAAWACCRFIFYFLSDLLDDAKRR